MQATAATRCAIYTRVSTEEQAREGYSLPAQEERLRAHAKSQGWTVYKLYVDDGYVNETCSGGRVVDPLAYWVGAHSGEATTDVTVNNVAPTLVISGAASVNEGSSYTLNLSATDPGRSRQWAAQALVLAAT